MMSAQRGANATTKPDDAVLSLPATGAFWTPSPNENQDLWIPFYAIRFRNWDEFGLNAAGSVDVNAWPTLVQKNTHYFLDV